MRYFKLLNFIIVMMVFNSCSTQDLKLSKIPYIEIEQTRIYLRYSTQEDVQKILGKTSNQEYYKNGNEDFNWDDFTVCNYEDKNLSFHYNNSKEVIRITINNKYSKKVKIPIGYLTDISSDLIIKDLDKSGDKSAVSSIDFYSYSVNDSDQNSILYSYWIDESKKIKWFDVYYDKTWK